MKAQEYDAPSQVNVASVVPLSRSHTVSVLSEDADTACFPSGVTATSETEEEWPSSVPTALRVALGWHVRRDLATFEDEDGNWS